LGGGLGGVDGELGHGGYFGGGEGVGEAADFLESSVDFGGGEAGEIVDVAILGGGEGEIAFVIASAAKWSHVLNTSNQASIFGLRCTNVKVWPWLECSRDR
jgi:hypothetical protein